VFVHADDIKTHDNSLTCFYIGLQCMCIEQVKTEINLSCLNKKKLCGKVKELSCVFMSSA
jgi:hypothetical protein